MSADTPNFLTGYIMAERQYPRAITAAHSVEHGLGWDAYHREKDQAESDDYTAGVQLAMDGYSREEARSMSPTHLLGWNAHQANKVGVPKKNVAPPPLSDEAWDFSDGWSLATKGFARAELKGRSEDTLKGFDAYFKVKALVDSGGDPTPVPADTQRAIYRAIYRRGFDDASAQYSYPGPEIIDGVVAEMLLMTAI
jgi:hypothetical protein